MLDGDGSANNVFMGLTTGNAKALGYAFNASAADAQILSEPTFRYDCNPRDGIHFGRIDFLGEAIHEFGHALGFLSGVDGYGVDFH